MNELIEALTIFAKYKNERWPTHCEHDVLHIVGITKTEMSAEDVARVEALGFLWSEDDETEEGWISFKYGSA